MGSPIVLFGAFDRHNLGDLLFPHIAAALLPDEELVFAGLAERDLRACGGHVVHGIARLAAQWGARPARLLHVGGETLSCGAWPAAVMLLPPHEAPATIAYLEARPAERARWLRERLGSDDHAPYVRSRRAWPALTRVVHAGVGGADLDRADPALRREVLDKLRDADALAVRDGRTQTLLAAEGIAASCLPDPAVMVAALFGERIRAAATRGEPAAVVRAFPQGYLAVQFSAGFGDDATLRRIAGQLAVAAKATGLGIVLMRAGAAPWHDALDTLEQVAGRLPPGAAIVFRSLDIWALCALIASSRAFTGSSLHGRIVALAFARPQLSLQPADPAARIVKTDAFAERWLPPSWPAAAGPDGIAKAIGQALAMDPRALERRADELAAIYREGFAPLRAALA